MIINRTVRQGDTLSAVIEAVGLLMNAVNRRVGIAMETTGDYTATAVDEMIVIPITATGLVTVTLPPFANTSLPRWIVSQSASGVSISSGGVVIATIAATGTAFMWPTNNAWVRVI